MSVLEASQPADAALTDEERLAELEAIVETGLNHYVRVGRALEEIRTRRLYLLTHETFREYLAARWVSRIRAASPSATAHRSQTS